MTFGLYSNNCPVQAKFFCFVWQTFFLTVHVDFTIDAIIIISLAVEHLTLGPAILSLFTVYDLCRPLNLPTLFTVRETPFYSEIGLSYSEICV